MRYFFTFLTIFFIITGSAFLFFKKNPYNFYADINGTKIGLENFNGEYKVIYFGYLYCPDVCPSALFRLSQALNELKRNDIKVIFITLDPERDTNESLSEMVQNFYKNSVGLNIKELEKVAKNYGVKYQKIHMPNSAMSYCIAHSSNIYLLDKRGKFYTEISNLTSENIKENLQNLLKKRL